MKTQIILLVNFFLLIFKLANAEVLIVEATTQIGFSASYNSDRSVLIAFRSDGAWLSSIIGEFSEENVYLLGLENLPHNEDNSFKSYKLTIKNLPEKTNVIKNEIFSLISKKFNLDLKYVTKNVNGFTLDFKTHTIPLKKTIKKKSEVWGIKNDKFVGYSFEDFRNVIRWNHKKPFEFRNAPKGFYTFELDGKLTDLQSILSWAKKYNITVENISSNLRFLIITKQG